MNKYALILFLALVLFSCGDDDQYLPLEIKMCNGEITSIDLRIDLHNLTSDAYPFQVRSYVATELSGYNINNIASYKDQSGEAFYLVTLDNAALLLFNANHDFICAEGEFRSGEEVELSYADLPSTIKDYLNANYSGITIKYVEFEDGEYEVELMNGLELCFDHLGNFLGEC